MIILEAVVTLEFKYIYDLKTEKIHKTDVEI